MYKFTGTEDGLHNVYDTEDGVTEGLTDDGLRAAMVATGGR